MSVVDNSNTIRIPSEIKYIKQVSTEILNALSPFGIDENRLFDIKLCVEEAVCNAIVHGNRIDKKLYVTVHYRINEDKIRIEIEDEGKGFDYNNLPNPTDKDSIMKGSGRGVYMIYSLMDEVKFNDRGNKISLMKRLK